MRGNTIDILLVEDNAADAKLFVKFLKGDLSVSVAETGPQALDKLYRRRDYEDEPVHDIVVLDLNIPLLNGLEVLKDIRGNASTSRVPVVVWSGSDRMDDINKAYELGCSAYMVKPQTLEEIESLLDSFADFWLNKTKYPRSRSAFSQRSER